MDLNKREIESFEATSRFAAFDLGTLYRMKHHVDIADLSDSIVGCYSTMEIFMD